MGDGWKILQFCLWKRYKKYQFYPHTFLKKLRGYCNRLPPSVHLSVHPLCYLLLNCWTKFNQIWCVSYSHKWGVQRQKFLLAPPPGEGSKGQISFNFNYKSNFKDFLNQTLCSFSQMEDTNHIRQDFHSVNLVMPQGWDFGALGVPRGSKIKIQTWSCGISNRWGWRAEQNASKIFILRSNWWPWGEVKRSNII